MTEQHTGPVPLTIQVSEDIAPLFDPDAIPSRDALRAVNNTPGTRVFLFSHDQPSRLFVLAPGEPQSLPFGSGQVFGYSRSTTDETEDLAFAEIEVWPYVATSPLEEGIVNALAWLHPVVANQVRPQCGNGYAFELKIPKGTDMAGQAAPLVNVIGRDFAGLDLIVRVTRPGGGDIPAATATQIIPGQLVRVEMRDVPEFLSILDVIAVDGDDELALFRGTVRGI